MISDNKLVEYIYDHIDEIIWHENPSGGFVGDLNKTVLYINGSDISRLTMTIVSNHEFYNIVEPQSFESTPIGKFVRFFNTKVFRKEQKPNVEEQAAKHIRDTLSQIMVFATQQCLGRYTDPHYTSRLKNRIWSKMTNDADLF